jgi:membrane protein
MAIFLLGSAALRAYINFIVAHNHAYGTLAAPIAALLFFFLLALGVLLGAEFNAAIEFLWPSPPRDPASRRWQAVPDNQTAGAKERPGDQSDDPPAGSDS